MGKAADFYVGDGKDQSGRGFLDVVGFTDDELESVHDYVQWLFPTREKSQFNDAAPVLTDDDVRAIRNSETALARLRMSVSRMRAFYKLFPDGAGWWVGPRDHNLLRLTRMLKSLMELGQTEEADRLYDDLVAATAGLDLGRSKGFWRQAVGR